MNNDLISIVIPVYNVEKYIDDCLISVLNQSYSNIEIILVNDGSTDRSGQICDKYLEQDKRIKVIHKKNGGLSDARNVGIENSIGKYITFIDSDDIVTDDFIYYLYNLIVKYKVDMSVCAYSVVTKDGKHLNTGIGYTERKMNRIETLDNMLCENGFTVSSCAKMYLLKLFDDIEFPIGKLCEDNATTYKLIEKCDYIAYGNESKYLYYKRDNSIMTSNFNLRKLDLLELVDDMAIDLMKYPELKDAVLKKRISSRFSILRQIVFSDYYNSSITDEVVNFLLKNKKFIIKSKKIEKREKIALIILFFGKRFFKFSWSFYEKLRY